MQDDLRQIDVCDGLEQHVQLLHPDVSLGIEVESFERLVDFECLVVGSEELVGLVECSGVSRCLVADGTGGVVGVGRYGVECLVDVQAGHFVVDGVDVTPDEDVPVAEVEVAVEGGTLDGAGEHAGVLAVGGVIGVVTADVEDGRLGVANVAEDGVVGGVPAIVPLCSPVVADAILQLIVPVYVEVEVDEGELHLAVAT